MRFSLSTPTAEDMQEPHTDTFKNKNKILPEIDAQKAESLRAKLQQSLFRVLPTTTHCEKLRTC